MTTLKNHRNSFNLSNDVEKIKAALMKTSQDLKGRAGEMLTDSVDGMKDKTLNFKSNIENYTAERPFKSLGIALLVGLIAGIYIKK